MRNIKPDRLTILIFLLLIPFSMIGSSEIANHFLPNDTISIFNHFYQMGREKPVFILNTNVGRLINKKMKEEEQEASLTITTEGQPDLVFDIQVRARGNIRKQVCYYPPVKLNLKKSQLTSFGFSKKDELKLVLQCKDNKYGKAYLQKELLAYDLYSVLDSNFMRTKLIEIQLWDGDDHKKTMDAFIVEEEDHYEDRVDGKILESGNVRSPSLQRDHYLKMVFFQYMIGNTDWTIPNKHNVEIVKVPEYPRVIAVPYDFDYSGLVATSYSIPHTSIPIANVKQRYFMGFQVTQDEATELAAYFLSMKDQFFEVCDKAYYLEEKTKEECERFLNEFFEILENEKRIKRNFVTKKK